MVSHIQSIIRIADREYDVRVSVRGEEKTMRCTVTEKDGIRAVTPHPDLMSQCDISPRLIASAVLAFDAASSALNR